MYVYAKKTNCEGEFTDMRATEAVSTRWNHTGETWEKRLIFTELLERACANRGIDLSWIDDERWTGIITQPDGTSSVIYGYDLGLNTSAAARIADSKADTYTVLAQNGVPAIKHERISPHFTDGSKNSTHAMAAVALEAVGLPFVAKPDAAASGGRGVMLCKTPDEVMSAIDAITKDGGAAAVSPYIDFDEYRVVVLRGEPRAIIAKSRQPGGWMHNHSKGAEHRLMSPDTRLFHELGELGVAAATTLELAFTTVDIARELDAGQDLAVLEANDSVSIVYPGMSEFERIAVEIYGDAVSPV